MAGEVEGWVKGEGERMSAKTRYWILFLIGAPSVGLLLLWWAIYYGIEWFSVQMVCLWGIMALDRFLYHAWRKESA